MFLLRAVISFSLFLVTSAVGEAQTQCTHVEHSPLQQDLDMALDKLERISQVWGDRLVTFSKMDPPTRGGYHVPIYITADGISIFRLTCKNWCIKLDIIEEIVHIGDTGWRSIVEQAHRIAYDCVLPPRSHDPKWDGPKSGWRTASPLYPWLNVSVIDFKEAVAE